MKRERDEFASIRTLRWSLTGSIFETAQETALLCIRQDTLLFDPLVYNRVNDVESPLLLKTLSVTKDADLSEILRPFYEDTVLPPDARFVYIEMELCKGVDLNKKKFESTEEAKDFVVSMIRELARIQLEHGFCHQFLHADNIVFGQDGKPKLIDSDHVSFDRDIGLVFHNHLGFLSPNAYIRNKWWKLQGKDFEKWMMEKAKKAENCRTLSGVLKVYLRKR